MGQLFRHELGVVVPVHAKSLHRPAPSAPLPLPAAVARGPLGPAVKFREAARERERSAKPNARLGKIGQPKVRPSIIVPMDPNLEPYSGFLPPTEEGEGTAAAMTWLAGPSPFAGDFATGIPVGANQPESFDQ
jgi:hypothetical protein